LEKSEIECWISRLRNVLGLGRLLSNLLNLGFLGQAVAPIKLEEYLMCGMPVLTTMGVGDTAAEIDA
jgi:hypothetical protein